MVKIIDMKMSLYAYCETHEHDLEPDKNGLHYCIDAEYDEDHKPCLIRLDYLMVERKTQNKEE